MTNYRRNHIAGATYFFTVNLVERPQGLLVEYIESLRHAHHAVQARHPFAIEAMVVLPGHLHAIWTLPVGDAGYALRWRLIKTTFSRSVPAGERRSLSRQEKGERGIWQRRYWEHTIRDELDYQRHVDYIHFNPVKHGLVTAVRDWPYSSFHRYVKQEVLPDDWSGIADFTEDGFGEMG